MPVLLNTYPGYVDTDYIYISDNDMIYKEGFPNRLAEGLEFAEQGKIVSLYNSTWHPTGDNIGGGWHKQPSIGGCSWLCKTELLQAFLDSPYNIGKTWDWKFVEFMGDEPFIVSTESFVQHIGEIGLHSIKDNFDQTDTF